MNRRWRIPILTAWGKLGTAAVGLVPFVGHLSSELGPRAPEFEVFEVDPTPAGMIETCGAALLVVAAVVSLYHMRTDRLGGLSPPLRWPYRVCLGGLEAVGVCAWAAVAWLRAAESYIGPH